MRSAYPSNISATSHLEGSVADSDGVTTTSVKAFRHLEYPNVPVHADLALKEKALARTAPQHAQPGRYQPTDTILAFLDSL